MHRILLYNEKGVTVTMTKTDIIDRLASETGVTKTDTKMMLNAFTGETVHCPEQKRVRFKPSRTLKDLINS